MLDRMLFNVNINNQCILYKTPIIFINIYEVGAEFL